MTIKTENSSYSVTPNPNPEGHKDSLSDYNWSGEISISENPPGGEVHEIDKTWSPIP